MVPLAALRSGPFPAEIPVERDVGESVGMHAAAGSGGRGFDDRFPANPRLPHRHDALQELRARDALAGLSHGLHQSRHRR